jgi:hypothetical protein
MALPRGKGRPPGFHYHLIDRNVQTFPFRPDDKWKFISSFIPIAFANGDKLLVGRTESQLFSVPVEKIRAAAEAGHD